ncbi:hypothetical protein HNR23_002536 [Nocardiopsis mwathae]|uniref:SdpI family protein n=1 Tax=Nocardiopsis mwathae TaxID=1472723 RepID=A0A7X0D688_9ACTN|nr:SdpI family protein [Nocardiopsis mwathae]MBB6172476.1 hypothetical protein [Nocardiopsis mwathae]
MSEWFVLGLAFGALSAFLAWTGQHAVRRGIDIHSSPGIRVPSTLRSEEAWLAAHRRAQPYFFWSAMWLSLAGIAFVVRGALAGEPGSATGPMFAVLAVMTALLAGGAVAGVRAAGASTP